MCRFLAYFSLNNGLNASPGTTMQELLFNTSNSLVKQSRHARLRYEPTNGDGFGVGWYPEHDDPEPGTFVSIEPAWSNRNLRHLASKVYTRHFFAHVRDASLGMPVSQSNCHPFQHERYLWMHNGHLDQFDLSRRTLLAGLSDRAFQYIDGNTDSEHAFALFLDQVNFNTVATTQDIEAAVLATLKEIVNLRQGTQADTNADMNFAVSNGDTAVFTRFASHADNEPPSLYYLKTNEQLIVASEPLTDGDGWLLVERNHMLSVYASGELVIKGIEF